MPRLAHGPTEGQEIDPPEPRTRCSALRLTAAEARAVKTAIRKTEGQEQKDAEAEADEDWMGAHRALLACPHAQSSRCSGHAPPGLMGSGFGMIAANPHATVQNT